MGYNKRKALFVLRTSKIHWKGNKPQTVKITSEIKLDFKNPNHFRHIKLELPCYYQLLRRYASVRGPFKNGQSEPFFVFQDGSPVKPAHFRQCLNLTLTRAGYNPKYYSVHGMCTGRAHDLLKLGLSVETIKKLGRWKSNAVFRYLC